MFSGPDAQLMQDAVTIAGLAIVAGMGLAFAFSRFRKAGPVESVPSKGGDLEERVQVLERIATDRTRDLADEIESLRGKQEVS